MKYRKNDNWVFLTNIVTMDYDFDIYPEVKYMLLKWEDENGKELDLIETILTPVIDKPTVMITLGCAIIQKDNDGLV